ncbi:MAG: hypothetical protein A2275_00095 [Bacteroidetes bacterium RIFOXYA12_FULL_35_11]|nr:MAG: hypothetical protein A2X01_06805 [Bacteroidetes bacterium GWF2_35_48]OFY81150.1 MAG: hypothetical protein A2275_00095 [Bacteroidetes bacterium RIFOXYA12_FULL_35_11]HBX49778.1 hypothetical protein [Bacteroidales bacterium]
MKNQNAKEKILSALKEKSAMKQKVYDVTKETFDIIKTILQDIEKDYNKHLKTVDNRLLLGYKDKGAFEAEIKIAGDLLFFNMHSNIFEFNRDHGVWKISYMKNNQMASYCGIINIYNFLSDSFQYNRLDDLGYLIGRIFINKDKHFFIEGKRELGYLFNDFGSSVIDKETMRSIIESAILYTLNFDLLVPPFDTVKILTVSQMQEKMNKHRLQTGKRLGFKFQADSDGGFLP